MVVGNEQFQLVKLQTHILKVQIHCHGCARKVKKLLKKIEGVYLVSIDAENHKVDVSGDVDCAKLIRTLVKSGKHAKPWSPADDQNQNVQGLPSSLLDDTPHNNRALGTQQPMMNPDFDWRREKIAGLNSLIGEADNFGATTLGNNADIGWREDIAPDAFNMEGNMRSLAFPDSGNPAGGYTRIEEKGYPGFPQLLSSPAYEHYYAPFVTSNNLQQQQQYKYNFPSNMMNLQNLSVAPTCEHYSSPPGMSNNLQQYQTSPAHKHFNSPLLMPMRNNMQQYQYPLPSPVKTNTDFLGMQHASYNPRMFDDNCIHLPPQGIVNPLFYTQL